MHIRWNMIYWLTKKEISKNSPAFLGYIITSHLLRTIEKCEKFSPVVRPTSLNTSKIHFSIFFISLMTRFKSIHRCNAFLSESLRATIWGVCATVLSVTIKSYSRLIFLIKNTSDHLGNPFLMFSGFVSSSLVNPASDGCVRETLTDGLDLIFTDIMGVLIIAERSGPDYSLHKFVFLRVICHRYYLT